MIWIIVIVIFLAFIFFSDKQQEAKNVQLSGGFYVKYDELIEYFYTIPELVVENKEKMRITFVAKNYSAVTRFTVAHGFEDVTIYWSHNSSEFGQHSLHWTFPETMPQSHMISLIENEVNLYQINVVNQVN
ncbi:hypothetical protein [Flavobacterium sp. TAB 87]|uniref:hypothetical protein n=1 Tax=Flavobacterium sp. TAB 87 TaxID=1729581 RepID=UPI00076C5F60|nr:hypothetical protein [Flavobacterium sp. TAB 87]KVV16404.1 hypothetical protein AP058_00044 [Flavobacterium sp. TAB 87]